MNRKNFFSDYLGYFGNPQEKGTYIHIAGTKGKTSTAYYVYQMLFNLGNKVGLFVSPHIFCERERIQYNGQDISSEDFNFYKTKIEEAKNQILHPLGIFDEYLLIAFLFFRDHPVDAIVLEVGIGGLHDSTNVIIPKISVISRIKKDHQELLGSRLWAIARQKLGIIKPGHPFVIGRQSFWVSFYIFFKIWVLRSFRIPLRRMRTLRVRAMEIDIVIDGKPLLLKGPLYMRENFLLAYTAVYSLGFSWSFPTFVHNVPGRMQPIEGYPQAFLDGAHNELATRFLVETLKRQFSGKKWKILLCVRKDKDMAGMIRQLKKIADMFIFCEWDLEIKEDYHPRYAIEILEKQKLAYQFVPRDGLNRFLRVDDNILVTGSFYHLALVSEELQKRFI